MKRSFLAPAFLAIAAVIGPAAMARANSSPAQIIPLYAKGTVASLGVPETRVRQPSGEPLMFNVSEPGLEVFRPAPGTANGTAVIIAPGGGFVALEYAAGGTAVARKLAQHGVTAFVLKYRTIRSAADPMQLPEVHLREMELIMARAQSGVPAEVPPFAGEPHAIEDGERAIAIVRQRAAEWGIDPRRVGVIGFSAGAYLAADLAIGVKASRPDFVALLYGGLRTPVPADAPPAFIAAAADDAFQPDDAVLLYNAWHEAGAAAEVHVYERGGHGFGLMRKGATSDYWLHELIWWMQSRGLIARENQGDGQ
ncbi:MULTISPECIES: alpha/beta hydrolase [unclassified Sphingomonas]|uniref:alpha/beta hydrolase n=1 Tax=Novosphingobium rhizosphaerae TaxID=1551649 RepID=UPI0017D7ED11